MGIDYGFPHCFPIHKNQNDAFKKQFFYPHMYINKCPDDEDCKSKNTMNISGFFYFSICRTVGELSRNS